jgi:PncC family amidohydrolase
MQEDSLEVLIGPILRDAGLKLALAESCTGGLIGHRVTNVAGSSDYYLGSVTAYAYEAKEHLLGVSHDTLTRYGAVSPETALEMAKGIRRVLDADIGVSVTGIAGPGGGMPDKPVGLVWIGFSAPRGDWTFKFLWKGNRVENKIDSAQAALQLIYDYLMGKVI